MKYLTSLAALLLAACASGPGGPDGPRLRLSANPSAVIAAELGFARLAQDKGQWTAFRETSTDDAVMFVPQRTSARAWLKGRADPPKAVRWSPRTVWSSCDGSYVVTTGPWLGPNSSGTFATVWQRQNNGSHKWVLDMSLTSEGVPAEVDTVDAKVADCKRQPGAVAVAAGDVAGNIADSRTAASTDDTLSWTSIVHPDGKRQFMVHLWKDGELRQVLDGFGLPPPPPQSPR
jgi:hypothetical protein